MYVTLAMISLRSGLIVVFWRLLVWLRPWLLPSGLPLGIGWAAGYWRPLRLVAARSELRSIGLVHCWWRRCRTHIKVQC